MKLKDLVQLAGRGLSAIALLSTAWSADPLLTNTTSFRIPFAVESASGGPVAGSAILFASVNGGAMEQVQRVAASSGGFEFVAPVDGRYAFAVRMTGPGGQLTGDSGRLVPELEVIVDTLAPELTIQLTEAGPGLLGVHWTTADSQITPGSLVLEYAEGADGRWQRIPEATEASGQFTIETQPGTSVAVRGSLTDLAGNQGSGNAQIVLSRPAATTGLNIPSQATSRPDVGTSAATAGTSGSSGQGLLGPSPFGRSTVSSPPLGAPAPVIIETQPAEPKQSVPPGPTAKPNAASQRSSTGSTYPTSYPTTYPSPSPSSGTSNAGSDYPTAPSIQMVNSHVFDLAYEVEDVGPSGVSAVELFLTERNGEEWFRYGRDLDLKTPFQVDTRGEGTFGFAIRVHNGLGFSDPPPQPGDPPSIVVTVDETAPVIRFSPPQVVTQGQGRIVLNWQVSELNPASSPVRLEYSGTPAGPWTPLFDWQSDERGYEMPIQSGLPSAMYFRLLARDAAGNIATAQTPEALIVDQQRPQARLLRVEPTTYNRGY